ncbi:hypothetical protein DIURU_000055 [Diutina rugosa]|uniref:Squalene synthase n=1 Tax=Diutina rugosa TaxID=5481 RepID=A0A642V028_DIURU|nr:uncharacterized protein DIURU_000055 [Diutina rugosa]KAA8908742.1 hypothetical protein DIURU_000055 [Diutina rugosa]
MGKLAELLTHPSEAFSVLQLLWFRLPVHYQDLKSSPKSLQRCYELLNLTSRSFAAVIRELHPELRDAVMLFYLVLRALDTVEDDMTIDAKVKVPLLRSFDDKLNTTDWTFHDSKEKDKAVLEEFDVILAEYHKLKPQYQDIIKDITHKMGNGMADYILDDNFNHNGVQTVKDYDLYCHYVAGLVGEGLTQLMAQADFCDPKLNNEGYVRAESMGLFLQKTNIIRDYREDLDDGRSFWPKEIWSKYAEKLPQLKDADHREQALWCINDLVLNALGHVRHVLEYLARVNDPSSFNFCAIPQVMAVATLALVYNNPEVMHKNVKIRKGTTCQLILESRTMPGVVNIFRRYIREINHKSNVNDPNYLKIGIKCGEIEQFCESMYPSAPPPKDRKPRQPTETEVVIAARAPTDKATQRIIDEEKSNIRMVKLGLLLVVGGALYCLVAGAIGF